MQPAAARQLRLARSATTSSTIERPSDFLAVLEPFIAYFAKYGPPSPPILGPMSATPVGSWRGPAEGGLRKAYARNGIPRDPDLAQPLPKRLIRKQLFWLTVVMLVVLRDLLVLLYQQVVPDQEVPGGILPGLGTEAIPIAAKYAAITAIPLSLVFLWADRFRPQRFWVWLMTFGWGACVATFVSAQVNTWAAAAPQHRRRRRPRHRRRGPRSMSRRSSRRRPRPPCCSGWRS